VSDRFAGSHPASTLVTAAELGARVDALGRALTERYADSPTPPIVVGVLKGSTLFLADLLRAIDSDVVVDFIAISTYPRPGAQSGVVRLVKDLESDISGRDVLVVEDIVDTGLTLNYLRRTLAARGPRSLATVTLLDKAARRIVPVPVEWRGFEIADVFVVGYGLDFQGRYRNLPDLVAVWDLARLANMPTLLDASVWPAFDSQAGC
jgi:hypoxanthine phosphoribosyltransferase